MQHNLPISIRHLQLDLVPDKLKRINEGILRISKRITYCSTPPSCLWLTVLSLPPLHPILTAASSSLRKPPPPPPRLLSTAWLTRFSLAIHSFIFLLTLWRHTLEWTQHQQQQQRFIDWPPPKTSLSFSLWPPDGQRGLVVLFCIQHQIEIRGFLYYQNLCVKKSTLRW